MDHPLLPAPSTTEEALAISGARAHIKDLRPVVMDALTACFGGDPLAAGKSTLSLPTPQPYATLSHTTIFFFLFPSRTCHICHALPFLPHSPP